MALEKPTSIDECAYFTKRALKAEKEGFVEVWVFKEYCPECEEGFMVKKSKKAKEYTCNMCKHQVPNDQMPTSNANIIYTCPHCGHQGEKQTPFVRKKIKGADTLRFQCDSCNKDIDVTKKFKEKKIKK